MSILKSFPLERVRSSQELVLKEIESAFSKGYRNVLVEAPVGSGKSAMAIAAAKFYGDGHILTPRKSLQDQYHADFNKESLVTMKGRSSYPCTYPSQSTPEYEPLVRRIMNGKLVYVTPGNESCNTGPCLHSGARKRECTVPGDIGQPDQFPCPYHVAIDTAQKSNIIVHNLHGFIFQTFYSERFQQRKLLVIDEVHELESTLRGFAEKTISLPTYIPDGVVLEMEGLVSLDSWADALAPFVSLFKDRVTSSGTNPKEEYEALIQSIRDLSGIVGIGFVVDLQRDKHAKRTSIIITPEYVGNLSEPYILGYGEKRLLMSGTIYSKDLFCRLNGLKPEETAFIKIGSSFPVSMRPIYMKDEYMVDTSHKMWDANFTKIIANIKKVMALCPGKGLIHAPSYHAGLTLYNALKDTGRVITHTKDNFQAVLNSFFAQEGDSVLISPICQQGVDFKGDRARFQIILRVPYPSTSDKLMAKKVKEDFAYYNYQALITFGQQIGRINRSEDDFGVTILMDSRFPAFISKNRNVLPKWLMDAIVSR